MVIGLLGSLRPKQWTKNLLVFAGYLFTIQQAHPAGTLLKVVAAFALFCAVSGATYIYNDAADAECDRKHPHKCKRPIASGRVPVRSAVVFATALLAAAVYASFRLDLYFGILVLGYLVLTVAYSAVLKHVVIVDLLTIAALFVIRAVAGAVVIHVQISPWLLICSTLLALFLGLAKRRGELLALEDGAYGHRKTLGEYSAPMLDQMLSIASSTSLMAYFLYTISANPRTGISHPQMMLTAPFVVYGLFRYLYLIHSKNAGDSPERLLLGRQASADRCNALYCSCGRCIGATLSGLRQGAFPTAWPDLPRPRHLHRP